MSTTEQSEHAPHKPTKAAAELRWVETVDGRWLTWSPKCWGIERHLAKHGLVDRDGWYLQDYGNGSGVGIARVCWLATGVVAAKTRAARILAGGEA